MEPGLARGAAPWFAAGVARALGISLAIAAALAAPAGAQAPGDRGEVKVRLERGAALRADPDLARRVAGERWSRALRAALEGLLFAVGERDSFVKVEGDGLHLGGPHEVVSGLTRLARALDAPPPGRRAAATHSLWDGRVAVVLDWPTQPEADDRHRELAARLAELGPPGPGEERPAVACPLGAARVVVGGLPDAVRALGAAVDDQVAPRRVTVRTDEPGRRAVGVALRRARHIGGAATVEAVLEAIAAGEADVAREGEALAVAGPPPVTRALVALVEALDDPPAPSGGSRTIPLWGGRCAIIYGAPTSDDAAGWAYGIARRRERLEPSKQARTVVRAAGARVVVVGAACDLSAMELDPRVARRLRPARLDLDDPGARAGLLELARAPLEGLERPPELELVIEGGALVVEGWPEVVEAALAVARACDQPPGPPLRLALWDGREALVHVVAADEATALFEGLRARVAALPAGHRDGSGLVRSGPLGAVVVVGRPAALAALGLPR